jgi:peptidoglycan/LPS O-acetylase OafA/YrhL
MSLHHTIACESPASRRFRRCAPLLLVVGLTALALAPGAISGDRPHQISLCGEQGGAPDACPNLWRGALTELNLVR